MTDAASLVLKVDATDVTRGAAELDKLTAAGERAEIATASFGRATGMASGAVRSATTDAAAMATAATASARGAMVQAAGYSAVADRAVLSSLAIRESLVLAREASRGNYTRMAGSLSILAQSMASTGTSAKGLVSGLLQLAGITKVTQDATAAAEAAGAAGAAAAIEAAAARAAANITAADTELALAHAAVEQAATATAAAAAQVRLTEANAAVAAAAAEAAVAEGALSKANMAASETAAVAAATTRVGFGTVGVALTALLIPLGLAFADVKRFQNQINDSGAIKNYVDGLGLTHKEHEKLDRELKKSGGEALTFGDIMKGVGRTLEQEASSSGGVKLWDKIKSAAGVALDWINVAVINTTSVIDAGFVGTFEAVKIVWRSLPAVFSDIFTQAANAGLSALQALVNTSITGLNSVIGFANGVLGKVHAGFQLSEIQPVKFAQMSNANAGAASKAAAAIGSAYTKAYRDAGAASRKFLSDVGDNAIKAREERIKKAADAIIADRTPKKVSDHGLADALATLDAQIKGQLELARAYQISDAEAIKAEAMQKAEEQAIRHKGDVALFYEKELALAIATRAADGAKTLAGMRAEVAAHQSVNEAVRVGTLDVSQMSEQLKLEATLRPLVAAESLAEGDAKKILLDVIRELKQSQAELNAEVSRGQALTAISADNDEIARMKLEVTLLGASNQARAIAIAQLEAEQRLRQMPGLTPQEQDNYVQSAIDKAKAQDALTTATNNYNASLHETYDLLAAIDSEAQGTAASLQAAFGTFGQGVGQAITALTGFAAAQQKVDDERRDAVKAAGGDAHRLAEIEALYARKSEAAQLDAIGGVVGGLQMLFKKHSAGYKIMGDIEKALAVLRLVNTIRAIALDTAHTGASIANSIARGAADMASGAAKLFSQLGVFAFPVVAAMVALLVGLGLRGHGGGSKAPPVPTAEQLQAQQGAGTVLGDSAAKSDSIAHSLDLMVANTNKDLEYSSRMVDSLRVIESGISSLASSVARSLGIPGGFFDASTLKLGTNQSAGLFGGVPILGAIGSLLFGSTKTTRTLFDQGIDLGSASLGDVLSGGIGGSLYDVVEQVKKKSGFLGIGGSTKTSYQTTTGALDPAISGQIDQIIGSLHDSVVEAAKGIGLDVNEALNTFQVEIGKISFKDLKGDEITSALEAVFSKVADQMAGFAVQGLEQFQKTGEGLFETLMRLAKDYKTVDVAMQSIGREFGEVGAASIQARENLIELSGGLSNFTDQVTYYRDNFLTAAERLVPVQQAVTAEMTRLGLAGVTTIDQFKGVVSSIDLTTDSGQQLFAALMSIAPAFHDVATAASDAAATAAKAAADAAAAAAQAQAAIDQQRRQLDVQLLQALGDSEGALALQRQQELAALDASLRPLQEQIYAAQDAASAQQALAQAQADAAAAAAQAAQKAAQQAQARLQLESQIMDAAGKSEDALTLQREAELFAMDSSLQTLQIELYAVQDVVAAHQKLVDTLQAAAQAASDAADAAASAESDAVQNVNSARDDLLNAYHTERDELSSTADKFRSFSSDLRAFRDTLTTVTSGGAGGYKRALASLVGTSGLAATGDEAALGALPQTAQSFLDESKKNARSLTEYQRDVAMVARYVDNAIKGSDHQVSLAEQQMIALDKQVGSLVDITDGVTSVHDAIVKFDAAQHDEFAARAAADWAKRQADAAAAAAAQAAADKLVVTNEAIAMRMATLESIFKGADRGGALAITGDSDAPAFVSIV